MTDDEVTALNETEFAPQIKAQAWSVDEPPTEPEPEPTERGWSLTWQYAVALFSSGIVLAIVIFVIAVATRGGDAPSAPVTSATTPTTPTTRSEQEMAAPFNQAFQAVYAKPGETVPRLQDALIDDHHVLKVALPAATTVASQLQALHVYMVLDWSTGEIMEFSASDQQAMDGLEMYLNLKLTPQGFASIGGSVKFDVVGQATTTPPPTTTPPSAVTVTSTVTDPTLQRLWGVVPNDLSCTQTSRPAESSAALFCKGADLPQGALYEFFPDRTTMNDNFDADLRNGTTVPCSGLDTPQQWHSRATFSQQSEGQVACIIVTVNAPADPNYSGSHPHVVWTLDSEHDHVVAWAEGQKGASIDAVFGWWTAHYPEATQ